MIRKHSTKLEKMYENMRDKKWEEEQDYPCTREILAMLYERVYVTDEVFSMVNVEILKGHKWLRNDADGVEDWIITHKKYCKAVPLTEYSAKQRLDATVYKLKFVAANHFRDKIERFYEPLPEAERTLEKIYEILQKWIDDERTRDQYINNPEYAAVLGIENGRQGRRGRALERWQDRNGHVNALTNNQQNALNQHSNASNPNQIKPGDVRNGWNNMDPRLYNKRDLCWFFITDGRTCSKGQYCVDLHLHPKRLEDRAGLMSIQERKEKHRRLGLNVREDAPTPTTNGGQGKAQSKGKTKDSKPSSRNGSQGSRTSQGSKGSSQGGRSLSTNSSFGSFKSTKSTNSHLNAAKRGQPREKVCCANGVGCKNQNKEPGVTHFKKQPNGT